MEFLYRTVRVDLYQREINLGPSVCRSREIDVRPHVRQGWPLRRVLPYIYATIRLALFDIATIWPNHEPTVQARS